jgi:hypothetical protein
MGNIPIIGLIPSLIESIPLFGETLLFAFNFISIYAITNMERENDIKKVCNPPEGSKIKEIGAVVVSVLIAVLLPKLEDMISGGGEEAEEAEAEEAEEEDDDEY